MYAAINRRSAGAQVGCELRRLQAPNYWEEINLPLYRRCAGILIMNHDTIVAPGKYTRDLVARPYVEKLAIRNSLVYHR